MHAVLFNFYGYKLRITHETFHAYLQSWSAFIRDLVHAVDNRKSNGLPSKLPVKCQISNLECTQLLMQNSRMLKKQFSNDNYPQNYKLAKISSTEPEADMFIQR